VSSAHDLTVPSEEFDRETLTSWIGQVVGRPVSSIDVEPLTSLDSASGVPLFRVRAMSAGRKHDFVLKIASPNSDWIARATHDHTVRESELFRAGLVNQLPPEIVWPVLATHSASGNSWLLLMKDISATPGAQLVPSGDDVVSADETTRHLVNLAALHREFFDRRATLTGVTLCSIEDWLSLLGPATIEREHGGNDPVTPHLTRGWDAFNRVAPRAVAIEVATLLDNPRSLVEQLSRPPATLVHGDFKFGNLGLQSGNPVATIALDWSQAMWGSPQLDLAWFLAVNSARLPFSKEEAISVYREALAVADSAVWQRDMDLALLGGGVLRLGWAKALGASNDDPDVAERERTELNWWLNVAERALRYLEPLYEGGLGV
jgi:hypothetical protein